jgi:hypothetical protein
MPKTEVQKAKNRAASAQWRVDKAERIKAENAAWYKLHKKDVAARTNARRAMHPKEANTYSRRCRTRKKERQAGRPCPIVCEVCRVPSARPLHFDHCHNTGVFRGWLCYGCNIALGMVKNSPETLIKLAKYLKKRAA